MTCDVVRERLLDQATFDFAALEPHLSTCAGCRELAATILHSEADLRQHVEDYVNTISDLDRQWARAVSRAGPPPRWRPLRLDTLALALAAAATLAVVGLYGAGRPPRPPDPEVTTAASAVPLALRDARAEVDAFRAVETEVDATGLDRKAEDAVMIEALRRKAEALTTAEAALVAATEEGEPAWRVAAWEELGELYAAMGEVLEDFPHPSYLTDAQHARYADGLRGKAGAQREKAIAAWEGGAAFAREHGLTKDAARLAERGEMLRLAMGHDGP